MKKYNSDFDWYHVSILRECLEDMKQDEYCITRVKGDKTKAINLDMSAIKILIAYSEGKTIIVEDW